jgi:hypothetical protein
MVAPIGRMQQRRNGILPGPSRQALATSGAVYLFHARAAMTRLDLFGKSGAVIGCRGGIAAVSAVARGLE